MFKWFINKKAGSERNIMSSGGSLTVLSVLFLTLMTSPASSETTVYSWQDENGTLSFSDNPTNAPSDAESNVLAQGAETQTVSETESTQVEAAQSPEPAPMIVTPRRVCGTAGGGTRFSRRRDGRRSGRVSDFGPGSLRNSANGSWINR